MAKKFEQYDNIFADSRLDKFLVTAVNAQSKLAIISNSYVGNKRKILAEMSKHLYEEIPFDSVNSVCDLFAGSSFVGAFFKLLGKTVYSNELLKSSYVNGLSLLMGASSQISKEDWLYLINNKNSNNDNFIHNNYTGKKFTQNESLFIDNYYANCLDLFSDKEIQRCVAHSTIIQYIMSHCFVGGRLNNGQVIASLEHRLQHKRNNYNEINFLKMKPLYFDCGLTESYFSQGDVFDYLATDKPSKCDLIYVDPPYGGQQSDYAFMYYFFEEYLSRQKYEDIDYLKIAGNKFSKSKSYKQSFMELLQLLPKKPFWAISYNDSSWADVDTISSILKEYKSSVIVKKLNYSYKYRSAENLSGIEYLFIGQ